MRNKSDNFTNPAITPESAALSERVRQAKRINHLTLEQIASAAGMYRPTVTNQINGKYNLDIRVVLAVSSLCPDISAEWLLRGEGDIIAANNTSIEARIARLEQLIESQR